MNDTARKFVRSLITDAITDARGCLISVVQRPSRLVALLVSHSHGNRTIYDLAGFLAETELRAELCKILRLALINDRFTEMQQYRLEYVLRILEEG